MYGKCFDHRCKGDNDLGVSEEHGHCSADRDDDEILKVLAPMNEREIPLAPNKPDLHPVIEIQLVYSGIIGGHFAQLLHSG